MIYISGYDGDGARVASAREQVGCWSFNSFGGTDDNAVLEELANLHVVIGRMRAAGATLLLACPSELAGEFVATFAEQLQRVAELN